LKERRKRTENKERRITHYNYLDGLEKCRLIFGKQPQRLRKINVLEK